MRCTFVIQYPVGWSDIDPVAHSMAAKSAKIDQANTFMGAGYAGSTDEVYLIIGFLEADSREEAYGHAVRLANQIRNEVNAQRVAGPRLPEPSVSTGC